MYLLLKIPLAKMSVVTSEINLRYLCSSSLQIEIHVWCCSQQAIYNTHTQGTLKNFIIQHSICWCYNFLQIVCLPFCHLLRGMHRILSRLMSRPGVGWGERLLLEIFGGCVPPGSQNPNPISDQKMSFSAPVFRPGLWAEIMSSLLRLERKQNKNSNAFQIRIFLFHSYSFGIETINTFIRSRSSLENHT